MKYEEGHFEYLNPANRAPYSGIISIVGFILITSFMAYCVGKFVGFELNIRVKT
jgi:hypothetical protein